MKRTSIIHFLLMLGILLAGQPLHASNRNEERFRKISFIQRKQFENVVTLSSRSLEDISRSTSPDELEKLVGEILASGSLSIGAREYDENNQAGIHRFLFQKLRRMESKGLVILPSLKGRAVVPVALDKLRNQELREQPSFVEIGNHRWPVHPLWPNGAMPSLCPSEGLKGPLVYVGRADWKDLKGLDLRGAIALMKFQGGRDFERLFNLGCQAVIVVEDDHVLREKGEGLYHNTPLPYPRFYVDRKTGEELISKATRKNYSSGDEWTMVPGTSCHLHGGHLFETRPFESIFVYIPPSPPMHYTVRESDFVERIALDFNVNPGELAELNKLDRGTTQPGQILQIPNSQKKYTVRPNDLLERLANQYSITLDEVKKANPGVADPVLAGTKLLIPNSEECFTVMTAIDSVSVVPDAPHGARIASNIAISLKAIEHLLEGENVQRRKGIVFGFLDAESIGGLSSRTFAEYLMLSRNELVAYSTEDASAKIQNYQAASKWFASEKAEFNENQARWFGEKWLTTRLEAKRISLAENRVDLLKKMKGLPVERADEKKQLQDQIQSLESRMELISWIRRDSLEGHANAWTMKIQKVHSELSRPEYQKVLTELDLTLQVLEKRLKTELEEELDQLSLKENNIQCVQTFMKTMFPNSRNRKAALGWILDFSSGSGSMGIKMDAAIATADFRISNALSGQNKNLEKRFRDVLTFASIQAGWKDEWSYLVPEDKVDYPITRSPAIPFHAEFWSVAEIGIMPLGTINDRLETLDTPADIPEHTSFQNLSLQARNALLFITMGCESPIDSVGPSKLNKHRFGRLVGQVVQFNMRSGIDASDPVPRALVYYPAIKDKYDDLARNTATHLGVRRGCLQLSLLNGSYQLPLEVISFNKKAVVYAYHLDRKAAIFNKVVDQGQVGTQKKKPEFKLLDGKDVEKRLVLTDVYPLVTFPSVDPADYKNIGGDPAKATKQQIKLVDAVLNGEPQHFGTVNPPMDYTEADVDGTMLLMPPGRRVRFVVLDNIKYKLLLSGEYTEKFPKGAGYYIGPREGDRNIFLPFTSYRIAQDMQAMAKGRQQIYRKFGITDQSVNDALDVTASKIKEAEAAMESRDWQHMNGLSRTAWGILLKNYPKILSLGREAVFSVILLMGLLLPACMFLETLVLGGRSVLARLVGSTILFVIGVLFLKFFHPAFQISVSPFIVVIAYVMILMSIVVLVLSYQKFDILLRRARAVGGEVESEEISLVSSLNTALSLGVSNLKKRPARTFLTALTVTVLTFSIVAFVSVKGKDSISVRPIMLDTDIEGERVEAAKPAWNGILFRDYFWHRISDNMVSSVRSEFGSLYQTALRGFYIETEGGNNADREGANQFRISFGKKRTILTGVMTFEPQETEFSKLHEAVSRQNWFKPEDRVRGLQGDRFSVILPEQAARDLGITESMIFDSSEKLLPEDKLPKVQLGNSVRDWNVIGILDVGKADSIRDITGKSLSMVDFLRSAFSKDSDGQLENEPPSYHTSWSRFAIIPHAAASDLEAKPRSIAVKFNENQDEKSFYRDIALRLDKTFFGVVDGSLTQVSTKTRNDIGGIAKIIVPVILCILIVLNTMSGNVDERKGEVSMLGAIGLSPRQISFLLLSESTVFSVLGIVFGTFSGLLFANMIPWISGHYNGLFSGLSFNFTSFISMVLATGTGLVVLLATLVPARKAAALAAPSGMANWELPQPVGEGEIRFHLPFTLTRGNAVGMMAFFRRFLLNHSEPTSEDFNCRNIRLGVLKEEEKALLMQTDMWLAPYDLDVAQHVTVKITPTENEGVFGVIILLARQSGTEESWMRVNYNFMDLVRRQFLLWRNLDTESRQLYIAEGAKLFQEKKF